MTIDFLTSQITFLFEAGTKEILFLVTLTKWSCRKQLRVFLPVTPVTFKEKTLVLSGSNHAPFLGTNFDSHFGELGHGNRARRFWFICEVGFQSGHNLTKQNHCANNCKSFSNISTLFKSWSCVLPLTVVDRVSKRTWDL